MDTEAFVITILEASKLFRYECSDKNDKPSKRSRAVMETLANETILLKEAPNLWLEYNAFNSAFHNTLKKRFYQQEKLDRQLFDTIYAMA